MSANAKRYVIVSILLLITGFLTFGAYSNKNYSSELYTQNIPVIIGEWNGHDLPISEDTFEVLETRDVFMRMYINPNGEKALFTVVFSKDNRKIAHPPEVCFAGGGWERTGRYIQPVQVGDKKLDFNALILQNGRNKQVVLYLYKAGDKFTSNYYSQQFNIMMNGMLRKDTSSALIRISSFTSKDDVEEVVAFLSKFATVAIPVLEGVLP